MVHPNYQLVCRIIIWVDRHCVGRKPNYHLGRSTLLSAARLPGAGFRILHNDATSNTRQVLLDAEAWNMFHGKYHPLHRPVSTPHRSIGREATGAVV